RSPRSHSARGGSLARSRGVRPAHRAGAHRRQPAWHDGRARRTRGRLRRRVGGHVRVQRARAPLVPCLIAAVRPDLVSEGLHGAPLPRQAGGAMKQVKEQTTQHTGSPHTSGGGGGGGGTKTWTITGTLRVRESEIEGTS